jgi:Kef-type K+ transport system membrane component KefB
MNDIGKAAGRQAGDRCGMAIMPRLCLAFASPLPRLCLAFVQPCPALPRLCRKKNTMSLSEVFLVAMLVIFTLPYLVWRLGRTEYFAPLVVVQIIAGIVLGPGVLGALFPDYYGFVFSAPVIQALNAVAQWAVMLFVWIAGIEPDLRQAWAHRRESGVTAGLALGMPLVFGALVGAGMATLPGWMGAHAQTWQFVLGIGMSCAVTALPILILFMEKLQILRQPIGQRILRYASLDDIAIWGVLALILMDWQRVGRQLAFLVLFALASVAFRWLMQRIPERDRWYAGLIWLAACGLGADWSGLHYMVGAFIAGAVMDSHWFDQAEMDSLRGKVLLALMPVFFLSTGLRTTWQVGGAAVFLAAAVLLVASVGGKLIGTGLAGRVLRWQPGEASLIGWLLQTKALIMIIFANVLLDKAIITSEAFTALLLMAVGSTMLTVPIVAPKLARMKEIVFRAR